MTLKVCAEPGCPELTRKTRCTDCTRRRDKARGTRQERGYDTAYDREKRRYQLRMQAGETFWCWRCPEIGKPVHVVDPDDWDLGHDNADRSLIRGPQCPESNRATTSNP